MNTLNSPGKTQPRPERRRNTAEQAQQQPSGDPAAQGMQPGQRRRRDRSDEPEDATANHPNDDEDV